MMYVYESCSYSSHPHPPILLLLLLLLHLSSTQVPAQLCLIGKRDPRRNPNRGQ